VALIEGVHDLILTEDSGSDGSGQLGARGGGAVTPATNPAAARLGVRRTSSQTVLWGSNRAGLGPVVISVTRVIHLGHLRASGVLGVARAAAESGLCGGTCRRAVFRLQERAKVTEDLVWAELQRRVAGGKVPAAGRRGARGGGRCRSSPGSWAPRVDS
jgi:hypothetical protein